MKPFLLVAVALVAVLDWLAVWKQWRRVGFFAKPLTIILLFAWLVAETRLTGAGLFFAIGLGCSLVGDVFLLLPPSYFLPGLVAFSLTHLAYTVGFMVPLPPGGEFPAVGLALIIGGIASLVMRRITDAQLSRGLKRLVRPTLFYAVLISLMLLSALWTLFRADWTLGSALLVSLGALLFYTSDLTNAWIRFVNPVRSGRVLVMVTYHLGQFLLMLGVVLNFRPW
jgi:uncharacterized membrane protein YhhN